MSSVVPTLETATVNIGGSGHFAVGTDSNDNPNGNSRINEDINMYHNSWVEAVAIIKFDEKHGQQVQSVHPAGRLSPSFLSQLKMISMPDCLESGPTNHEFIFLIKTKDTEGLASDYHSAVHPNCAGLLAHGAAPTEACPLYCYVSFRQCQDASSRRGYFQQSLVVISKLPLHSLHFNLLSRLSSVLADIPGFELVPSPSHTEGVLTPQSPNAPLLSTSTSIPPTAPSSVNKSIHLPFDLTILDSTLEVAFQHFVQWPKFRTGKDYNLPFYGSIIPYTAPALPLYTLHPHTALSVHDSYIDFLRRGSIGVDRDAGLFASVNIFSIFGRLGLLSHIWTLWELVISGKDIVVWSQNAAISSAVVLALVSLATPYGFCGDYRPYINSYDSDISYLSDLIASRKSSSSSSSSSSSPFQSPNAGSWSPSTKASPGRASPLMSPAPSSDSGLASKVGGNQNPKPRGPSSIIIGITNPFLLRSFNSAHACLLIPNPESKKPKLNVHTSQFNQFCSYVTTGAVDSPPTSPVANKSSSSSSGEYFLSSVTSFISSTLGLSPRNDPPSPNSRGSSDRTHSLELAQGRMFRFSPLGLAVVQPDVSTDSPSSSMSSSSSNANGSTKHRTNFSSPAFESRFNTIGATTTLESIYDSWVAEGGDKPGSSKRYSLLVARSKPLISPDYDIQSNLTSIQKGHFDVNTFGSLPINISNKVSVRQDERCWADEDDKSVIGNMLIRGHFQALNLELTRPFESIFTIATTDTNVGVSPRCVQSSKLNALSSSDRLSTLLSSATPTRAGASSMYLYNNTLDILGKFNPTAAISHFVATENAPALLPKCIRLAGSSWQDLALKFAHSDHFDAWSRWRRDIISTNFLIASCGAYQNISLSQVVEALAIEQGREIHTSLQMEALLERMHRTVYGLRRIEGQIEWLRRQCAFGSKRLPKSKGAAASSVPQDKRDGSAVGNGALSVASARSNCDNNIGVDSASNSIGRLPELEETDEGLLDTVRLTIERIDADMNELTKRLSPQQGTI